MAISRYILFTMRNILDESCRENEKTHFLFSNFFSFEKRAVYEIILKNVFEPGGGGLRYDLAQASCMLDKQGYMLALAYTRPYARTHARMRAHIQIYNLYAFPQQRCFSNAHQCYVKSTLSCLVA